MKSYLFFALLSIGCLTACKHQPGKTQAITQTTNVSNAVIDSMVTDVADEEELSGL